MSKAKLALVLATAAVLASWTLTGWVTAQAAKGKEVSLELIWRKSADEELISEKEGFPPPEIEKQLERGDVPETDKEWLLNALRVEIARKERVFYTNDGRAFDLPRDTELLRWRIAASQNFKYSVLCPWRLEHEVRARMKKEELEEYERQKKRSEFILMDSQGTVLWRQHDMPERIYISDDGKTVVGLRVGGEFHHLFHAVCFYDSRGELINTVKLPSYGVNPSGCAGLSVNGDLFYVMAGLGQNLGYGVFAYGPEGDELWRKPVSGVGAQLWVSPSGNYVVASVWGRRTHLLDRNGHLIRSYDFECYSAAFSEDESRLVLMHRYWLSLAETSSGKISWQYSAERSEFFNEWVDVLADRKLMVVSRYRYTQNASQVEIAVLNEEGDIVSQAIVDESKSYTPTVSHSPSGFYIKARTGRSIAFYAPWGRSK